MKKYVFSLCFTLFLLLAFPVYAYEAQPLKGTAVVNVEKLNVRSGPAKEYEKQGTLSEGVMVEVNGIVEPDWYIIEFEGEDGYINSEYVIFTPEEEIEAETGKGTSQKTYVVMALIVLILIVSGVIVYTFMNMQKNADEDMEEEEDEVPVTSHDDTNMHLGEVTYDTYRIDIDPKYFEKTTMIPQPESIWNEDKASGNLENYQEEMAEENGITPQAETKTDIKNLDSKLEQASAQIKALQKEVEELKKSQTGSII